MGDTEWRAVSAAIAADHDAGRCGDLRAASAIDAGSSALAARGASRAVGAAQHQRDAEAPDAADVERDQTFHVGRGRVRGDVPAGGVRAVASAFAGMDSSNGSAARSTWTWHRRRRCSSKASRSAMTWRPSATTRRRGRRRRRWRAGASSAARGETAHGEGRRADAGDGGRVRQEARTGRSFRSSSSGAGRRSCGILRSCRMRN